MINGGYAYKNLFVAQNPNAERVFYDLFSVVKPERVLEIGSMHGGLTLMISDILNSLDLRNTTIRTYDIHEQKFLKPLVGDRNIEIRTKNLFTKNYSDFKDMDSKNEVLNFVSDKGTTVVLCDGGCKKCEFNIIAPLLKVNDIIMAHDYAPNKDYFDNYIKNKIWNWIEIQDSDIIDATAINNLQPYLQDMTQQAAWLCRIKRD